MKNVIHFEIDMMLLQGFYDQSLILGDPKEYDRQEKLKDLFKDTLANSGLSLETIHQITFDLYLTSVQLMSKMHGPGACFLSYARMGDALEIKKQMTDASVNIGQGNSEVH